MLPIRKAPVIGLFLAAAFFSLYGCKKQELRFEESLRIANQKLSSGQTGEAISLLEEIDRKYPTKESVLEALAFAHAQKNNPQRAAYYFSEMANSVNGNEQFFLYAAQSLVEAGNPQAAGEAYENFLQSFPESGTVWNTLAALRKDSGEPMLAVKAYLRSFELSPSGESALDVAQMFHQMGSIPQAETWYQVALEAGDGQQPDAYLGLFRIALEDRKFAVAEKVMRQLEADYPNRLEASNLAHHREELIRWRRKQDELAQKLKEHERIARKLRQKSEQKAMALAEAESIARRETEAVAAAEAVAEARLKAVSVTAIDDTSLIGKTAPPEPYPALARNQARLLKDIGDVGAAVDKYWEAIKLDDRPAETWFELSDALLLRQDLEWAEVTALEAVRRAPDNIHYNLHYLKVVQRTQPEQQFLQELVRAKNKLPDSPEITLALARGYKSIKKNYRNAAILYREFLHMAPNHPQRNDAEYELSSLPVR